MNVKDIQNLLTAISRTLAVIKDFPVFEEVVEDNSYYTMSDLLWRMQSRLWMKSFKA